MTESLTVTYGREAEANAGGRQAKDVGVGLIVEDENYDRQLTIVERGTEWDAKALYENGAQAGKYRGNQLFAAWIQGPHTKEYLNANGVPVWMYAYRITYPDGKTFETGPLGFYTPGFACFGIKTGSYTSGTWKIDWNSQGRAWSHHGHADCDPPEHDTGVFAPLRGIICNVSAKGGHVDPGHPLLC